jgi:hypothetical protein
MCKLGDRKSSRKKFVSEVCGYTGDYDGVQPLGFIPARSVTAQILKSGPEKCVTAVRVLKKLSNFVKK